MALAVDRSSPRPLYRQVAGIVAGRIATGELSPGDMTSELVLMEEFGVSRVTVRQALDRLEREGRIFRVPGKGTFISERRKLEPQSALTSFSENMRALGMEPGHKTVTVEEAPATLEESLHLELRAGAAILRIDRILLANDIPMATMAACLPPWVYTRALDRFTVAELDERSLYSIIENDCEVGLFKARETVECVRAGVDGARLGLGANQMLLSVRRLTLTEEKRPVEFTHLKYRSDLYRYQVELYRYGAQPLTPPRSA